MLLGKLGQYADHAAGFAHPAHRLGISAKFLIAGFEARYVWTEEVNASGDKRKVPDKRLTEANVMDAAQYLMLSEVRGSGLSPHSFPETRAGGAEPGVPSRRGAPPPPGLVTGYDILNPNGGLN